MAAGGHPYSGYSFSEPSGGQAAWSPVRLATTADVAALAGGAPLSVDGNNVVAGNRILVRAQTNQTQNGIYIVVTAGGGANGTWVRATDANTSADFVDGKTVAVGEGTTYHDSIFEFSSNAPFVLGVDPVVFQNVTPTTATGWTRDAAVPVVKLTVVTDPVTAGTATPVAGCKLTVEQEDAATVTNSDLVTLTHRSSGVVAPGFSTGILFRGETDTNAVMDIARISANAAGVTPGAEKGGLDFWLRTGGAALSKKWSLLGSGNWTVTTDAAYSIGDKTNRLLNITSNEFRCYVASGDANPSVDMATTGVYWGPGDGTPLDVRAARTGTKTLTLDDTAGGDATLVVRTLGTTALRSDTVTRGANRTSRTVTAVGVTNLLASDDIILFNNTTAGAAQTPTLPDLATHRGMTVNVVRLYDVTAFTVTITPTGADKISSMSGVVATMPILAGVSVVLHAPDVGVNWIVL